MNLTDLAWAAGLFEGEGTAGRRCVQVGMTDLEPVEKLLGVLGVGRIYFRRTQNPKWADVWTWQTTTFEEHQAVAAMLWPWLCSRRRGQIARSLTTHRANYSRSLSMQWLGKRHRDLNPEEKREYNRRSDKRRRSQALA